MAAVLLWIVTTGISLLFLYLVIRTAINHSVMVDLYHETRQLTEQQVRNGKAIAQLTDEVQKVRRYMEEQPK